VGRGGPLPGYLVAAGRLNRSLVQPVSRRDASLGLLGAGSRRLFKGEEDISVAIHRINTEADVIWVDGHSDYGHAFEAFWERWTKAHPPSPRALDPAADITG
jgi:hypothetical protein